MFVKTFTKIRLELMLFIFNKPLNVIESKCHGYKVKVYYMNFSGFGNLTNNEDIDEDTILLYVNCKGSTIKYVNSNKSEFYVMKVKYL